MEPNPQGPDDVRVQEELGHVTRSHKQKKKIY